MNSFTPELASGIKLTIVELFGDISLKNQEAIPGFLAYNALAYILMKDTEFKSLALVNSNWDAISNICTTVVGALYFNESYTSKEWAGLALISIGLFLLQ